MNRTIDSVHFERTKVKVNQCYIVNVAIINDNTQPYCLFPPLGVQQNGPAAKSKDSPKARIDTSAQKPENEK